MSAGHSERRTLFGETDDTCRQKVNAVLQGGPGHSVIRNFRGARCHRIRSGLSTTRALAECSSEHAADIVVAYEPVWAIGTVRLRRPLRPKRFMLVELN